MSEEPVVSETFKDYLDWLVEEGLIRYMRRIGRKAERPSIVVKETKYSWGWFSSWEEFRWTGPGSYWNEIPEELESKVPYWKDAWSFAIRYNQFLWADNPGCENPDVYKKHLKIDSDKRKQMDAIKQLCVQNHWPEAMQMWRDLRGGINELSTGTDDAR